MSLEHQLANWNTLGFAFAFFSPLDNSPVSTLLASSRSASSPSTSTSRWVSSRSRASRPLVVVLPSPALRPTRSPRSSVSPFSPPVSRGMRQVQQHGQQPTSSQSTIKEWERDPGRSIGTHQAEKRTQLTRGRCTCCHTKSQPPSVGKREAG